MRVMNPHLFHGQLVRLTTMNPETDAELVARWNRDSEYLRSLDSEALHLLPAKKIKEELEREIERSDGFVFMIHTLADDRPIGFIELDGIRWTHGDAWVGIGIGEREDWGKGYGTDAMRVLLRYAFAELNLHRVSLDFFEYNVRAGRSYEKAGFVVEGRKRQE